MSWSKRFVPAIPLPTGGELQTLHDARAYILDLPEATQQMPRWQAAIEALLLVADAEDGPEMWVRIGMMRALYPVDPFTPPEPRRKRAKTYKIIR
jgi:hypothetical protein